MPKIDSLAKLNKFVASEQFINAYDFINPKYTLTYIMDAKGTGKSYAFMKLCIDKMLEGDNFVWIRNTLNEFTMSQVPASFNKEFVERKIIGQYVATAKGVYKLVKVGPKRVERLLVGLFAYASNFLANSSQNALKQCKWIIWDEFINPDFNKPNLFGLAMKAFDTYKRTNIAHVFCLANKHTTDSDMLEGSGIEFDWSSNQNQAFFDDLSSTQAFYIGKHIVAANKASREQINAWGRYNANTREFYEGHASAIPNKRVVNWDRNNINAIFTPIWKFTVDNQDFCFGKLENGCFYIKAMFYENEFPDTKGFFCFYPRDKTEYNVYLHPLKDKSHFKAIIDAYCAGILYYDWVNTQDVMKRLLFFIDYLERPERNTI